MNNVALFFLSDLNNSNHKRGKDKRKRIRKKTKYIASGAGLGTLTGYGLGVGTGLLLTKRDSAIPATIATIPAGIIAGAGLGGYLGYRKFKKQNNYV